MRLRAKVGPVLAIPMLLASAGVSLANEQFGTNLIAGSPIYDGLMGNIGQLTNPATVAGITYVHAGQIDVGPSLGDFIGVGVKNGKGTVGGTPDCADDYGGSWSGYYDAVVGGLYECRLFAVDSFGVGSYPTFKIEHASCNGGQVIWNIWLSGTLRGCEFMGVNAGSRVITLLETASNPTNHTDRNIDVRFINLKWSLTGSSAWNNYGNPGAGGAGGDLNYTWLYGSVTSHWIYLPPLD